MPKFAQLYIHDTENEVSNRVHFFSSSKKQSEIDTGVVDGLIQMFDQTNAIVKVFRMARDIFKEYDVQQVKLRVLDLIGNTLRLAVMRLLGSSLGMSMS